MDRKSRPGRWALRRDGRKAGLRCRKLRPKVVRTCRMGAVPAGGGGGGSSAVTAVPARPHPGAGPRRPRHVVGPALPETPAGLGRGPI